MNGYGMVACGPKRSFIRTAKGYAFNEGRNLSGIMERASCLTGSGYRLFGATAAGVTQTIG
jgi:hypothetical protein